VILSTGGTIAARVDYRTGGVISAFSANDLIAVIPELAEIANIRGTGIMKIWSGDMRPDHYKLMAGAIAKELEEGVDGIVLLQGTDTMHYTSAMLSFMLRNLPVPVVITGAQRSSDRGSSDAAMNLICGVNFAANADFSGVVICMHGTLDDKECHIHSGTRVKKMHTSRRDAFKSIDRKPIAKVDYESRKIEFIGEHPGRRKTPLDVASALETKVGILRVYPGLTHEQVAFFRERGYHGLVVEGTGLGHMSIDNVDELTKENERIAQELRALLDSGCIVVMTSQCPHGDINMNVYSYGRDLLKMGVISGKGMLPEVAYVKLMWLIGNYGVERARTMISENIAGEIVERREINADFEEVE
jgi:glutamyl-tRNA(Gln) amidotransferase subunit D